MFGKTRARVSGIPSELELALEMTRFGLRRFGVPSIETQAIVQRLRRRHQRPDGEDETL